ncbi:MAG: hypothetical protein ABJZ69_03050, partial [Hyphomicrobiales bacterium]
MPNLFAYIVLLGWPAIVACFFWKLEVPKAIIWSILLAYLFLPVGAAVDLPLIPALDKHRLPSLTVFVICLFLLRKSKAGRKVHDSSSNINVEISESHRSNWYLVFRTLLLLLVITPFFTVLSNSSPIFFGPRYLPGLDLYDGISILSKALITILPLLLAKRFLATPERHVLLLSALCLAGVFYSLFILFEVRMSPQLNRWIYGFFPHSFSQHMRAGGFRPIVFLQHGLWVSLFCAMCLLAAGALWRQTKELHWILAVIWLLFTLYLTKSLGAFTLTILFLPVLFFLRVRGQLLFATCIAVCVLIYPLLRGAGAIPVDTVYEWAQSVDESRGQSLKTRLDNEDALLIRAGERPLAGWGGYERALIFDPVTGENESITDGAWIIIMGNSGWLGYLTTYG